MPNSRVLQQGLTTDFEQNSLTSYEGSSLYNRSDAGNWTNGFPVNGGAVVPNVPYANLSNTLSNIFWSNERRSTPATDYPVGRQHNLKAV